MDFLVSSIEKRLCAVRMLSATFHSPKLVSNARHLRYLYCFFIVFFFCCCSFPPIDSIEYTPPFYYRSVTSVDIVWIYLLANKFQFAATISKLWRIREKLEACFFYRQRPKRHLKISSKLHNACPMRHESGAPCCRPQTETNNRLLIS